MVFPSSFSLTLYVTASPSPTMKGLCIMRGPSNRTLWIIHPMDCSNVTTSFLDGVEFIVISIGSVCLLTGFHIDCMFSPGHASAIFSDAVIFSRPKAVDHPVYTCLVSSRPALLKPEPYAFRLYLRTQSPTDRDACTETLSAVSSGFDTSINGVP
jgi:hypothetical protein